MELTFYPLILVICLLPWVVLDIISGIANVESYPSWLSGIADVLWNSQGFLNALAYGLSRKMCREFRESCLKRKPNGMRQTVLSLQNMPSKEDGEVTDVPLDVTQL